MAVRAAEVPSSGAVRRPSGLLTQGVAIGYLSVIVLLPLAALTWKAGQGGWSSFWDAVTAPEAVAALKLTLVVSALVALVKTMPALPKGGSK